MKIFYFVQSTVDVICCGVGLTVWCDSLTVRMGKR